MEREGVMSEHTPGPWTCDIPTPEQHPGYLYGGKDICIWAGDGVWLANVEHRQCQAHPNSLGGCEVDPAITICTLTDEINREQEANARLIAAAPDLLEALREVEWGGSTCCADSFCRACGESKTVGHSGSCPVYAAIAKAEGR